MSRQKLYVGMAVCICLLHSCLCRRRGLGLDFNNPVKTGGVLDVCLCCGGELGLEQGLEEWGDLMCV